MPESMTIPNLIIGGGSAGAGSAGISAPGQFAIAYQNLLSGAAEIVTASGSKEIILTTGIIGMASPAQVGNTETLEEQQQNLAVLTNFASYCRNNNITIDVDADLTSDNTYGDGSNAVVEQWATTAAQVGLPIGSIEDVNEVSFSAPVDTFAHLASVEANAVPTLIAVYASANSPYK